MTFLVLGGLERGERSTQAAVLTSTSIPIFLQLIFQLSWDLEGLPASVIIANSSVHGAILTTQVTLPAGPWPQQPQELNSSPANSPMVLKFAF